MKSRITALFITLFALSTVSYAQSAHSGSVQVALMDGSVRFVSSSIDQAGGAGKVHFADLGGGVSSLGVHDSLRTNTIQIESVFPATFIGGVRVATADLSAASESQCMASTDFSAAVPVVDGFVIQFDRPTTTIRFNFGIERELGSGCKVVRLSGHFNGGGTVDAADYVVWRKAGSLPTGSTRYTTTVKLIRRAEAQFETYYHFTMKHVFIS